VIVRLTLITVGFIFGLSFSALMILMFARHPFIRGNFVIPFKKYEVKDGEPVDREPPVAEGPERL
jgi:hypothetical protein